MFCFDCPGVWFQNLLNLFTQVTWFAKVDANVSKSISAKTGKTGDSFVELENAKNVFNVVKIGVDTALHRLKVV